MKNHDRGWATLEVGMTMLIVMIVVVFGVSKYRDWQQEKSWQTEAARTSAYAAAARGYVGRNYAALLGASTTTTPTIITTAMLKNTGFLPSGFTETNSQGQRLQTYLVRNAANPQLLQGMVVSNGGSEFPLKALIMMARDIRTGFGGYIDDGLTVTGAMRAWRIPLNSYGAVSGKGHLAVLLSSDELSGAQEDSDRLYRFQVNGRPDLNKMHTSIDMGTNNLNNVATLQGQNGNFSGQVQGTNGIFSNAVHGANALFSNEVRTNYGIFNNEIRSTNGIFTNEVRGTYGNFSLNLSATGQVRGGNLWSDSDINAMGNIAANGQITGTTLRAHGNLSAGGVLQLDQVNNPGWACYPNGTISRDASGAVLSCQSGVWRKPVSTLERTTWTIPGAVENYGDACQAYVQSSGMIYNGWVATGSDACTEDGQTCTFDNVRCFAVRLQ